VPPARPRALVAPGGGALRQGARARQIKLSEELKKSGNEKFRERLTE
jgi:hypothetical protein